jgi:hypothetical protein
MYILPDKERLRYRSHGIARIAMRDLVEMGDNPMVINLSGLEQVVKAWKPRQSQAL